MLEKITNNLRIKGSRVNLQFKALTFISLITLGYISLLGGGVALAADVVAVNPGDNIKFTFDTPVSYNVKLRYYAKTSDGTAVGGTDYDKIDGWVEVAIGTTQFSVETKTYNNADATKTLNFDLDLDNPQYDAYGEWKDISPEDKVIMSYGVTGRIIY